ncbi:MAG: T9SS type A sorting domain-containing protein [Cyclobacteriaceae bacterium]
MSRTRPMLNFISTVVAATLIFIYCLSAHGQGQPVFLGDINQEEDGSNPRNFVKVGSSVYFIASETIGFDVWRTDGTKEGTFALDWFNDQYDRTDWKFLIHYDDSKILIQTHDALYLTTGMEGSLQRISSQAQDKNTDVNVNNGRIFWAEPTSNERRDVIKASDQSASVQVLLEGYELVRFVKLDSRTLIVCRDDTENYKTFISDGTVNGTVLFTEQNVMAADEDAAKVVFSAINLEGNLFQLYAKSKATSDVEQLTFFNETGIPSYSKVSPIVVLRDDVIFFTKRVERDGRYSPWLELHRWRNGQVSLVGGDEGIGFDVDILIESDTAMTILGGQSLFSVMDNGEYYLLGHFGNVLNWNRRTPFDYYHYDGTRFYYFTDSELIVSESDRLNTRSVKLDSKISEPNVKSPNHTLSRHSKGMVVLENLIIAAGNLSNNSNELLSIDWQTGEEALLKDISMETRALTGADFTVYNDKLYIASEGRIWVTDGTPEGTINITSSDFSKFQGTPRFVTGFDHLYVFGVSEDNSDSNVLIKIESDQPVRVYEGYAYGEGNLYYLFRAGADAVFLYSGIESFALTIERDDIRLRLPYSIQTHLPARASTTGYLADERFLSLPDQVFFRGWTREHGYEPWVIDIEQFEIRLLGDLDPESDSYPIDFIEFNDKVIFRSRESDYRQSLFRSDGTAEGTSIYFTDFPDADETKEASISRPRLINGNLYFTSFYEGTERLYRVNHKDEFQVLDEREQTDWSRAPQLMEFGHNLILHDWVNSRFYNRATGEAGELDWSIIPNRNISIGNYIYDALSYGSNFGALARWNKLTLEEEIYSDDPNKELPITTLGRKLITLKYAEGFGHELWALDVGLQDRLAQLSEMEVMPGEAFLPYISDIEEANFTFTIDDPSAITFENGAFYGQINGVYTLDLHFEENEIYNGGTVSISIEVTDREKVTSIQALPALKIYPNPADQELSVELPNHSIKSLKMIDLSGKIWHESRAQSSPATIAVKALPRGMYILQLETATGDQTARKVLIQR